MSLDALHRVIHNAESASPDQKFDVALVDDCNGKLTVFRISEIFVDDEHGLINLVFNGDDPVNPR